MDELQPPKSYSSNQAVITHMKQLREMLNLPVEDAESVELTPSEQEEEHMEWYPNANIFYPYTEDACAFTRSSLLRHREIDPCKSGAQDLCKIETDTYYEDDAHLKHLANNPISYIIIGKPNVGQKDLGKSLAELTGAVYLDPEKLIKEEIASDSHEGQCITYNLQCGRSVGIEVIMRLLDKRLQVDACKHRGAILADFPLIPNELFAPDPVSRESAIFTVQEIFEELLEMVPGGPAAKPSQNVSATGSKTSVTSEAEEEIPEPSQKQSAESFSDLNDLNIARQVHYLFRMLQKPVIIIYMCCSNNDVILKHDQHRFDLELETTINLQKDYADKTLYTVYSRIGKQFSEVVPDQSAMVLDEKNLKINRSETSTRYLLKVPSDFLACVAAQLEAYRYTALPEIEFHLLNHNQDMLIKVDARVSAARNTNIVRQRLRVMNIPPVVVPKMMHTREAEAGIEEEEETSTFDWNMPPEEAFRELRSMQTVSPMFKWQLSHWGHYCPVALAEGKYTKGLTKFSARFFNKIFFMSSKEALEKFIANPRTYLLPPNPRPPGRIFVMGPVSTGKSTVARFLSALLDETYLDPSSMEAEYLQSRAGEIKDIIRNQTIASVMRTVDEENLSTYSHYLKVWEKNLKIWTTNFIEKLNQFVAAFDEINKSDEIALSPFPLKMRPQESDDYGFVLEGARGALIDLGFPHCDDIDLCREILNNPSKLEEIFPEKFKKDPPPESATVFHPLVEQRVEESMSSVDEDMIAMTGSDYVDMFVEAVLKLESERKGWVVDGMPPHRKIFEALDKHMADTVIILSMDDNDVEQFYSKLENSDNIVKLEDFLVEFLGEYPSLLMGSRVSTLCNKNSYVNELIDIAKRRIPHKEAEEKGQMSVSKMVALNRAFNRDIIDIRQFCAEQKVNLCEIDIAQKDIKETLKEVMWQIHNRQSAKATVMTAEDKAEELKIFGNELNTEEQFGETDESETEDMTVFAKNRRLGETSHFCPVVFVEHDILWKGRENFAAHYCGKTYLMSSQAALEKFTTCPQKYLPLDLKTRIMPSPKICFVGQKINGKTVLAKHLCRNLGLYYINFDRLVLDEYKIEGELDLDFYALSPASNINVHLQNYIKNGKVLPEATLTAILRRLWKEEPIKSAGFIIDGFPKCAEDVEFMFNNFFVPDAIIRADIDEEKAINRSFEYQEKMLKAEAAAKFHEAVTEHQKSLDEWKESRVKRLKEYLREEMKKRQRLIESRASVSSADFPWNIDINNAYEILDKESPKPVLKQTNATDVNEVLKKYKNQLLEALGVKAPLIQALHEALQAETVPYYVLSATESAEVHRVRACQIGDALKFRTQLVFEKVHEIQPQLADWLLNNGVFFLSRFGKVCPVDFLENQSPIHMFLPSESRLQLYPVIHRQNIYFISGSANLATFKNDPLKYVNSSEYSFPVIPAKIAIIGPPKCGKSQLAEKMRKEYDFKIITRGSAVRFVLKNMANTDIYHKIEKVLYNGEALPPELIAKAVEVLTFHHRSITQGFVYDGFPNSIGELMQLETLAIQPLFIIDLKASLGDVLARMSLEKGNKYNTPDFSKEFITHRYEMWQVGQEDFRNYVRKENQNLYTFDGNRASYFLWREVSKIVIENLRDIQDYFRKEGLNEALTLRPMCITPFEFLLRRSEYFKDYCPCCLFYDMSLTPGGSPPNRTGLMQYREHYYWICPDHVADFIKEPKKFVYPYNINTLPAELPEATLSQYSSHLTPTMNGFCVVCYEDGNLTTKGSSTYPATYKNVYHWFCSKTCMVKFMKSPEKYFDKEMKFKTFDDSSVQIGDLPIIGYLEQEVAKMLVHAVTYVGITRPYVIGLGESLSALINIGLHLKVNNPKTSPTALPMYWKAYQKFLGRRDKLPDLFTIIKNLNPFCDVKCFLTGPLIDIDTTQI